MPDEDAFVDFDIFDDFARHPAGAPAIVNLPVQVVVRVACLDCGREQDVTLELRQVA